MPFAWPLAFRLVLTGTVIGSLFTGKFFPITWMATLNAELRKVLRERSFVQYAPCEVPFADGSSLATLSRPVILSICEFVSLVPYHHTVGLHCNMKQCTRVPSYVPVQHMASYLISLFLSLKVN